MPVPDGFFCSYADLFPIKGVQSLAWAVRALDFRFAGYVSRTAGHDPWSFRMKTI
jgi:hypothetical protein